MDEKKIQGLKSLGFDDGMIAAIQETATAREKAADAAGVTFKETEATTAPVEVVVEAAEDDTSDSPFLGDFSQERADAWLDSRLSQRLQPILDGLNGLTQATSTKSVREEETQVALKTTQEAIGQLQASIKTEREAVDTKLTQALTAIKELQGDVPAGIKRASLSESNIATKEQIDAFKGPAADPMNEFLGFIQTGGAG